MHCPVIQTSLNASNHCGFCNGLQPPETAPVIEFDRWEFENITPRVAMHDE